jgi:hypothetical protein
VSQDEDEKITPKNVRFDVPDWLLQMIVNTTNTNDSVHPITLLVGGFLVSGELVSGKRFFAEALKLDEIGKRLFPDVKEDEEPPASALTSYIHLRNARVFHPAGPAVPANEAIWFRVRLAEVAGFTIGFLAYQPVHNRR